MDRTVVPHWLHVARRVGISAAIVGAGFGIAACGSSTTKSGTAPSTTAAAPSMGKDCTMSGSIAHAGRYTMVAVLGPSETMYTQAEVAKQHPASGEVMLRGVMTMAGGTPTTMAMSASTPTTMAMAGGTPTTSMMGSTTTSMTGSQDTMQSTMTTAPMTTAPMTGAAVTRHLEVHICSSDGRVVTNADPTITLRDAAAGGAPTKISVATMQGIGQGVSDLHYGNNVPAARGHHYIVTVTLDGAVGRFSLTA